MFGYEHKPHPLGLMFNLNSINMFFEFNLKSKSNPLPNSLYLILLLPKSQKHLINKKYHKFVEQEKELYVEEHCEKCKSFNSKKKALESELIELISLKKPVENIKKEISTLVKTISLHKKQHSVLALDDIDDIYKRFLKIKS